MISIVIPLYNKEKAIIGTLESVKAQSYWSSDECLESCGEVIIVNDGSTDHSAQVVEDWLSSLNSRLSTNIRLINQPNGGVCSARNRGIQEAKGEFIALLDGDDQWDKDYLLEMMKMIADFPECAMWGVNYAELYDGKLIRRLATGLPDGYRGVVEDYFTMPSRCGRISDLYCSSSVVIRKEVFDKVGNFDERLKYSEDIDMWYRIIANYPVAFYDKYLCHYLYDAENRAMNRKRLLRYWLPFYADKYKDERFAHNHVFYQWIMRWCAIKIKHIYFKDSEQRQDAKQAIAKLDMSVLPRKYKQFFGLPFPIAKLLYMLDEIRMKK